MPEQLSPPVQPSRPALKILGGIGYGLGLATEVRFACVGCKGEIAPVLARLGSVTCHDCRRP